VRIGCLRSFVCIKLAVFHKQRAPLGTAQGVRSMHTLPVARTGSALYTNASAVQVDRHPQRGMRTTNRRARAGSAPVRSVEPTTGPRAKPQPALFRMMCAETATRWMEGHACVTWQQRRPLARRPLHQIDGGSTARAIPARARAWMHANSLAYAAIPRRAWASPQWTALV
jgi:hypothetical protein